MSIDTRQKIITVEQAAALAAGSPTVAFVTHLEVLRAEHVHKIAQTAAGHPGKLFLILTDPEAPLSPLDARAEVAAALRQVDYVIPAPDGAASALAALHPTVTIQDEDEDRGRTRQLMEHVRNRSRN